MSFGGGYSLGLQYGSPSSEALYLGRLLAATSVGISVQVLQQFGLIAYRVGEVVIAAAVIDDIVAPASWMRSWRWASSCSSARHFSVVPMLQDAFLPCAPQVACTTRHNGQRLWCARALSDLVRLGRERMCSDARRCCGCECGADRVCRAQDRRARAEASANPVDSER